MEKEMNGKEGNEDFFGDVISVYTSSQGVEDGILMMNPKMDRFSECNLITTNLWSKIEELALKRSMSRVFEITPLELLGSLMIYGEKIYSEGKFVGDNDKDFFVVRSDDNFNVWFVRNETGKLTAMLPEDY